MPDCRLIECAPDERGVFKILPKKGATTTLFRITCREDAERIRRMGHDGILPPQQAEQFAKRVEDHFAGDRE